MVIEHESDRLRQLDRQLLGVFAEIEVLESKLKTDDTVIVLSVHFNFIEIVTNIHTIRN